VTQIGSAPIRLAVVLAFGLALAAPSLAGGSTPRPPTTAHAIPAVPQVDWKLVSTVDPPNDIPANRIYYARVPRETGAWRSRFPQGREITAALHQDFSRYGLLAVFLTRRDGIRIDSVYTDGAGGLTIQITNFPPPPMPTCGPGPCPTIPPPPPALPRYLLIAIRKGSIPAPVQRLYISETMSDPPPVVVHDPPPPPSDEVIIGGNTRAVATVIPSLWRNCTRVHRRYPHGVGKPHAHDKTSGTAVTTFRRSTRLYNIAMRYNRGLDADKDGIACEAR
jgi:hypothetical protein